jgi:hypothetical protein
LLGVTAFFGIATEARIKNQTISEVNAQGQFAIDTITQTVRNADSITAPALGASGASLTVAVPTANISPTVFSLSAGTLTSKEGTAAAIPLTNSDVTVTAFTIKNVSKSGTAGAVQISLTLSRVNSGGRSEYNFTRTFTATASVRQ